MNVRKNRFYYYYRLIKWKIFNDRSPVGASIKITNRCNLNCTHCGWEKHPGDEISLSDWKNTTDRLYEKGVSVVAVEGGEPTLRPDASEIVNYIRRKGLYCIFITNGTRDFSGINPDVFWISIDGPEEHHDRIRGKGAFRKTIKTIKENRDKKIISLTSLSKSNVESIEPMCEYLSPLLSGLMFNFTYPYGNIKEDILTTEERMAAARRLIDLKKREPKVINSFSYLRSVGNHKKISPWLLISVASNGGTVQGCIVRHLEQEDCSQCDMGCCTELSKIYELKRDAVKFWNYNFGLPRII